MKNYAQLTDTDMQLYEGYAQYMKQYYKERTRYTPKSANQYHRNRIGNS